MNAGRQRVSNGKEGRERRAVCLTDGYCSVSSRNLRTSSLTVKAGCCPTRDEAPDSKHMPSCSRDTLGEHTVRRAGNSIDWSLRASLWTDCMKVHVEMHWAEAPYPVVSPAVGYYFCWPHTIRDATKVNLPLTNACYSDHTKWKQISCLHMCF